MPLALVSSSPQGSVQALSAGRDPVDRAAKFEQDFEGDDGYRLRMRQNLFVAALAVVLIGVGIWIVDAMVDTQRAHGCYTSGQRYCS
jgi:hypothetical protein